jgi:hypothetical protein
LNSYLIVNAGTGVDTSNTSGVVAETVCKSFGKTDPLLFDTVQGNCAWLMRSGQRQVMDQIGNSGTPEDPRAHGPRAVGNVNMRAHRTSQQLQTIPLLSAGQRASREQSSCQQLSGHSIHSPRWPTIGTMRHIEGISLARMTSHRLGNGDADLLLTTCTTADVSAMQYHCSNESESSLRMLRNQCDLGLTYLTFPRPGETLAIEL